MNPIGKLFLCVATLTLGTPAFAGRIVNREVNQQERIAQGVASGALTPRETARLEGREARLNREIRRDRWTGGGLSWAERARIERQQNRLSRSIWREKHDAQVR